jgi:hypothetical protein
MGQGSATRWKEAFRLGDRSSEPESKFMISLLFFLFLFGALLWVISQSGKRNAQASARLLEAQKAANRIALALAPIEVQEAEAWRERKDNTPRIIWWLQGGDNQISVSAKGKVIKMLPLILAAAFLGTMSCSAQDGTYIYGHDGVYAAIPQSLVQEVMDDAVAIADKNIADDLADAKAKGLDQVEFRVNEGHLINSASAYIAHKYPNVSTQTLQYLTYVSVGSFRTEWNKKMDQMSGR